MPCYKYDSYTWVHFYKKVLSLSHLMIHCYTHVKDVSAWIYLPFKFSGICMSPSFFNISPIMASKREVFPLPIFPVTPINSSLPISRVMSFKVKGFSKIPASDDEVESRLCMFTLDNFFLDFPLFFLFLGSDLGLCAGFAHENEAFLNIITLSSSLLVLTLS